MDKKLQVDSAQVLLNYQHIIKLDLMMKGLRSKYPFQLNERAKYTQHQVDLYLKNYCQDKKGGTSEQIDVALVSLW